MTRRHLYAFLIGAALGLLLEIPYWPQWVSAEPPSEAPFTLTQTWNEAAQAPTITIPPNWQGWVCAQYTDRQSACQPVDKVRWFLDQR